MRGKDNSKRNDCLCDSNAYTYYKIRITYIRFISESIFKHTRCNNMDGVCNRYYFTDGFLLIS